MRGLDPRIHVFAVKEDVDGRVKPGHDDKNENEGAQSPTAA